MLRYILALAVVASSPCDDVNFGVLEEPASTNIAQFGATFPLLDSASEKNLVLLWKHLEASLGAPIEPHKQTSEGDCVGQAFAIGVDILTATEIHLLNEQEQWVAKASIEMIYAGSRVEIGEGKMRGKPGSHGEWAAKYLQQYGVLHRLQYDKYDLRGYDPSRSRQYRDAGVPDSLEPIAREHPVKKYTVVSDFNEACDAMAGGQPVIICASYKPILDRQGKANRDENGFIDLETGESKRWCKKCRRFHGRRKKWQHAWCAIGFDRKSDNPGIYIINSHGKDWIDGPRPHGLPEGAFKLSPENANLMIKDWGQAYAISAYVGHPGKRVEKLRKFKLYL